MKNGLSRRTLKGCAPGEMNPSILMRGLRRSGPSDRLACWASAAEGVESQAARHRDRIDSYPTS